MAAADHLFILHAGTASYVLLSGRIEANHH
jgi:hypothetical protein